MQFLVDEDLPRSIAPLLKRYGHEAIDVRDTDLRGAKDSKIAAYAQQHKLCLLTGDYGFADIRNYPPNRYSGLVILEAKGHATASLLLNLLDSFLRQATLTHELSGKLVIVEPGRIRLRK